MSQWYTIVRMQQTTLIGTAEVARIFGKSHRTIHRMVKDGRLTPAMKAPGGYAGTFLFDRATIVALAAKAVA